jgi:hypothetical protein
MTLSSSGLPRGSPYSGKFNFKIPDQVGNDQYFSEYSIMNVKGISPIEGKRSI